MTPHCFDMPDDPRQLAAWLEGHLVDDSLGDLIAELCAAHPLDEVRSQSLADAVGNELATVLTGGLTSLTEQRLRSLIRWPWLLRELQQRVLLDGGNYWQNLAKSRSFDTERERVWGRVFDFLKLAGRQRDLQPNRASRQFQKIKHPTPNTAPALGRRALLLVAAAAVLMAFGVWRAWPRSAPWGWNRPGVFAQDVSAEAYLQRLANAAEEYFQQPRDSAKQLEQTLTDFRRSCDVLLAAKHEVLNETDRAWLRERCQTWSSKFDEQRIDLRRTGDVATVRTAADETVGKLITAIRKRAA